MIVATQMLITPAAAAVWSNDYGLREQIEISVAVANPSGSAIRLGGSTVNASQGWPLAAGREVVIDLQPGETLYAAAGATQPLDVLKAGR